MMENIKYQRFKESAEKIESDTQNQKSQLIKNLTELVENIAKFLRFIDQKIEISRTYYYDKNKREFLPEVEYYSSSGILLYANIQKEYKTEIRDNEKVQILTRTGKYYYLLRSGQIDHFNLYELPPQSEYASKKEYLFKLNTCNNYSTIADIIETYYEDEIDIEITILRNIYRAMKEAIELNPKKIPILKGCLEILESELKNSEEEMEKEQTK